jgi:acetyl-CoA acetyltransferase
MTTRRAAIVAAPADPGRHVRREPARRPRRGPRRHRDQVGLEPLGFLAGWAAAGCDPATMGIGPVPAVERLFYRTGLGFSAIDLVELNEAFAVQVLAVLAGWQWNEPDKLNVNGSGISLGHPIGLRGRLGRNLGPCPPPHLQIRAVPSRP